MADSTIGRRLAAPVEINTDTPAKKTQKKKSSPIETSIPKAEATQPAVKGIKGEGFDTHSVSDLVSIDHRFDSIAISDDFSGANNHWGGDGPTIEADKLPYLQYTDDGYNQFIKAELPPEGHIDKGFSDKYGDGLTKLPPFNSSQLDESPFQNYPPLLDPYNLPENLPHPFPIHPSDPYNTDDGYNQFIKAELAPEIYIDKGLKLAQPYLSSDTRDPYNSSESLTHNLMTGNHYDYTPYTSHQSIRELPIPQPIIGEATDDPIASDDLSTDTTAGDDSFSKDIDDVNTQGNLLTQLLNVLTGNASGEGFIEPSPVKPPEPFNLSELLKRLLGN